MGDISRHRDIFLNTRDAIPGDLLSRCSLTKEDLTYLEMGNYLTDVSQFRDPVFYIFAKQNIWREFVLPEVGPAGADLLRGLVTLLGYAAAGVLLAVNQPKSAGASALLGSIPNFISDDLIAGWLGVDDWIDRMFGVPIERMGGRNRKPEEYGYVGQFFQHFIEGITHLLFSKEVGNPVAGEWGRIDRLPQSSVTAVYREFFTQYYPHEHTDQPPYVWDASKRPQVPKWYGPSKRQADLNSNGGVMNVVDRNYVQYLAQGLSRLEADFRRIPPQDAEARRKWLVRLGKLLHGVEDWYFHSNIVELIRLRSFKPAQGEAESGEQFLRRFVQEALKNEPLFIAAGSEDRVMYRRRLYRRLRAPVFKPGNKANSGGILSREASNLSLDHAYPAFPSQEDSTHTLLGALENLEGKVREALRSNGGLRATPWAPCVMERFLAEVVTGRSLLREKARARGVTEIEVIQALADWRRTGNPPQGKVAAAIIDVLREVAPLVVTLLYEEERSRLVQDVDPLAWPAPGEPPLPPRRGRVTTVELDKQLDRHLKALEPKPNLAGVQENNYARVARYLQECGFLNEPGRDALVEAFKVDRESEQSHGRAPGSGGTLIRFAVKLQRALEKGDEAVRRMNRQEASVFLQASDNGAFNEIIGSHSLMSKDTLDSFPFFEDAKVLASVASQAVFHLLLDEAGRPAKETGLDWPKILHHFIRYPVAEGGWERRALTFSRENRGRIPAFADLPELDRLKTNRLPAAALAELRSGKKAEELEEQYTKLEKQVSHYRYP